MKKAYEKPSIRFIPFDSKKEDDQALIRAGKEIQQQENLKRESAKQ